MESVTANGTRIPRLGFGTYQLSPAYTLRTVSHAIEAGYRHIDTAQIYGNEAEVGAAIEESRVPRSEIFLTTKVWVNNYPPELFHLSVDESLRKLRTEYVDLLLLHWPNRDVPLAEQIGSLNQVVKAGKARAIGLSNFNRALMRQAVELTDAPLVTNQVEYHPFLDQSVLIEDIRRMGLAVTVHSAMAIGKVFQDPLLLWIARERGKSVAQIVLRWLVQQDGVVALSRTSNVSRLASNAEIFDFELSSGEMSSIHSLARPDGRYVSHPGLSPVWD